MDNEVQELLIRLASSLKEEDLLENPELQKQLEGLLDSVDPQNQIPQEVVEQLQQIDDKKKRFLYAMKMLQVTPEPEAMKALVEAMQQAKLLNPGMVTMPGQDEEQQPQEGEQPQEDQPQFSKSDIFNFIDSCDLLFKSFINIDFDSIDTIEDRNDNLIKAFRAPKFIGELHPHEPDKVGRQHPGSKILSWHLTRQAAANTEQRISDSMYKFLGTIKSPVHKKILENAIWNTLNSPTRHFTIGWDKNPNQQVIRSRHIRNLIEQMPSVKLDLSDPNKVTMIADRHREAGPEKTKWTLTAEGGHQNGETFFDNNPSFQKAISGRGAGWIDEIHARERSLGNDSGGICSFLAELFRHHRDTGGVQSTPGSSQNLLLLKSPAELEEAYSRNIGKLPAYEFNPRTDIHIASTPLKGGLYHHVFKDKSDDSLYLHAISDNPDHKSRVLSSVMGNIDGNALNVGWAHTSKENQSKGYGRMAYLAALLHHGAIRSDNLVSSSADKVWRGLKEKAPGVHVRLGSKESYEDRHSAKISNKDVLQEYLSKSDGSPRKLVHYSHLPGLTRLDPKFYGTGHRGKDYARSPVIPRTYYYLEGTQPEDVVTNRASYRYTADIPEGHKVYDIGEDADGIIREAQQKAKTRQVNPGVLTPEEKEGAVMQAGYHGFFDSTHPSIPNVVAYFHPLDVQHAPEETKAELNMSKSFFDEDGEPLEKVGEGYKKLMANGIALLHPVTIGGQKMSQDGIPFHTTIKVFHPEDDSFSEAHQVASSLNFVPPDPEKTTVKPMIFKDRFGDDVHVLELGGDAERIVEHNSAFANMGFPVKYKFKPHITIDEPTYNAVLEQNPKVAADLGITFHDAELRHGYDTVQNYPSQQVKQE